MAQEKLKLDQFQVVPYEASDDDFMKCYLDCGTPLDQGVSRNSEQYQCWTDCRLANFDARTQHIERTHHLSASEEEELGKELDALSNNNPLTAAERAELEALERELSGLQGGRRKRKTRRKRRRKRKKTKNRRNKKRRRRRRTKHRRRRRTKHRRRRRRRRTRRRR